VANAAAAVPRAAAVAGCDIAADTTCPARFIETFGRKAYRRPLEAVEESQLLAVFEAGRAAGDALKGFQTVVEAILQSPFFLYHDDTFVSAVGATQHPSVAALPIDPYVLAARLSFFLLGSTPDELLMAAAEQGKLSSGAELITQVRRLLASEAANEAIGQFHRQWLGVADLPTVDRDTAKFPASDRRTELTAIDNWYAKQVLYLLQRPDSVKEGNGTLLDNTLVVVGRELGSTAHRMDRAPFILAGGAAGALKAGRWLSFDGQPHAKLLVSIGQMMGLEINTFGNRDIDSGPLAIG